MDKWIKDLIQDEKEYSADEMTMAFRNDDSVAVYVLKTIGMFLGAAFAFVTILYMLSYILTPVEPVTVTIPVRQVTQVVSVPHPDNPTNPTPTPTVKPEPTPTPVVSPTEPTEELDWDNENNYTPPSSSSSSIFDNIFGGVIGIVGDLISNDNVEKFFETLGTIGDILTNPNSEEVQKIIDEKKQELIIKVDENENLPDEVKETLKSFIGDFEISATDIGSLRDAILDFINNGDAKLNKIIDIITKSVENGTVPSEEEIKAMFDDIFGNTK